MASMRKLIFTVKLALLRLGSIIGIRESVDSLCRDGTDTPYTQYKIKPSKSPQKNQTFLNFYRNTIGTANKIICRLLQIQICSFQAQSPMQPPRAGDMKIIIDLL